MSVPVHSRGWEQSIFVPDAVLASTVQEFFTIFIKIWVDFSGDSSMK